MSDMPPPETPRRLRIAVFNRAFTATGGGAERYSIELVEQLAARHEIHVFAQEIAHDWPGVQYHHVSMPMRKPRWVNQIWFATATWWATRGGFDIVHSHENTWHGDVQTVHVLPVKFNLFQGRDGLRRVMRWVKVVTSPRLLAYLGLEMARYAPRPGRQVVLASRSLLPMMAASYPTSGPMLSVVTPGITLPPVLDAQARAAASVQARTALGLPQGATCLLFVGNDYRKKGLPALLDALLQLPPDLQLAVVGNPAHIPAFRDLAERLGLAERVFFLGALPDVAPAYAAADLLLHPTLEDTFAMVVLEAMGHGLPVVVSGPAWCGIAGLLSDGEDCVLLDDPQNATRIAEAVRLLLDQPALRATLATGARAFAARYEWSDIAAQQEAVYFASLAGRADAARRPG